MKRWLLVLSVLSVSSLAWFTAAHPQSAIRRIPEVWHKPTPCVKCGRPGTTEVLTDVPDGHKATWLCGKCWLSESH